MPPRRRKTQILFSVERTFDSDSGTIKHVSINHPRKSLPRPTPRTHTRFCAPDISRGNFAIGFLEISCRLHFSDNALGPMRRSVLGMLRNRLVSKVCDM